MLGAIIGDIAGARFEWTPNKSKNFELFVNTGRCCPTDDSVMTLAVARAILECSGDYTGLEEKAVIHMQALGRKYPRAGYGSRFYKWIMTSNPEPYNSFGNGSAMRVSPCAWAAGSLDEAKELSYKVTKVSHNHPEGIKGAEAVTAAIYMALHGSSIPEIREYIDKYYYPMNFTLDDIRPGYSFDVTCQGSVPQAIMAFLESSDYEDAIRSAISLGGDSDTQGAIAGSIAEAYYGIPEELRKQAFARLDETEASIVKEFEAKYPPVK